MLKLKDLVDFKEWMATGGWADAFSHAEEDLRLEMLGLIEELLEAADIADRVVGEVVFAKDGISRAGGGSTPLGEA
jgi:hypothetical protein